MFLLRRRRRDFAALAILFFLFVELFNIFSVLFLYLRLTQSIPETSNFLNITLSQQKRTTDDVIPAVLHQTWKSHNLSDFPVPPSTSWWSDDLRYSNFTLKLWTDQDINQLIQHHFPHIYAHWLSLSPIQRADLGRLAVLYQHGGFYADLDVYPAYPDTVNVYDYTLERWRYSGWSMVCLKSKDGLLMNHFIMSRQQHPLLARALDMSVGRRCGWLWPRYLCVFWTTGPILLAEAYLHEHEASGTAAVLSFEAGDLFVNHGAGRSWHNWEACVLTWLGEHAKALLAYIGTMMVVAAFITLRRWRENRITQSIPV